MEHLRQINSNETPFECDHYQKRFKTARDMSEHWKSVHSEERNHCNKAFKMKSNLTKHISSVHDKVKLKKFCFSLRLELSQKGPLFQSLTKLHFTVDIKLHKNPK